MSGSPVMLAHHKCLELISPKALGKLQQQVCGFEPQSKSHEMLVVNFTLSSLSMIAIILRLVSRYLVSRKAWSDDLVITLVAVSRC